MMACISLSDRIKGCLLGAAIGSELGFAREIRPEDFAQVTPDNVFDIPLKPALDYEPPANRAPLWRSTPLVDVGVRSYLAAGGRATPEDFGRLFRDDPGVAFPAFQWDGLHTVQEILKEGMNPRISGLGTFPCGLVCAAMPAVGAFHFAHPEYAYLDGVELASVAQSQPGADWAGVCAAAIAAAFDPELDGAGIADAALKVAFRNCRELFYDLDWANRRAHGTTWMLPRGDSERFFIETWLNSGAPDLDHTTMWIAWNPPAFVLPLLARYVDQPRKLMALLLAPPPFINVPTVACPVAGAIAGAFGGPGAFPEEWLAWARPIAEPWFELERVVCNRVRVEAEVIEKTERLAQPGQSGRSLLQEKVCGCILAGAIGNAMGSPVEGRTWQEIDEMHPGGITTVLDPSRLEGEDDNQMAMLLAETYLDRDGLPVMARHFGKTWKDRLNRNHFYPYCMGHTYDLICKGWDARVIGHWAVVTGSTVMALEPVGVYHLCDPDYAAIDATAVAYMYQRGLDVLAASMLAATVAEAFKPDATVESVCQAALAAAPTTPLKTFDERPFSSARHYIETCLEVADRHSDVLAARPELYARCLLYHHIDPLEVWGLALAMFKIAKGDVRQAAIGGTNIGRDSDTIAGRAAMLAGIVSGASNVPQEWQQLFRPETLERIHRNSARLADLIEHRKLFFLRKRQACSQAACCEP